MVRTALPPSRTLVSLRPPAAVPSCLLLDIVLPDLNGLELQRLTSDQWSVTPIIFVTGYGDVPKTV